MYYGPYGRHAYGQRVCIIGRNGRHAYCQRVCIIGRMVVMHKVSGCVL